MKKIILGLVVGVVIGALASIYFLGALHSKALPGVPLQTPAANAQSGGTVAVTIDEKFFDSLLGTLYQQLGPPQLKLSDNLSPLRMQTVAFQSQCDNVLTLNQEGNNVRTGVRFTGGKILAPLAFNGSYRVLTNCFQFTGTAKATIDLSFDQTKQTVFGRLNIDEISLENAPALVSGLATAFVRKTIDERFSPFEVLHVNQLALSVPIKASGGALKAQVKDVRDEVQEGSLKLYLTYDFSTERR